MADDADLISRCLDLARARLHRTEDMIQRDIRALHSYWERLRAGREVPYRAEVDPRDMDCDARHLFILEDLGAGNLRFRLAGSALTQAFGTELRGMSARTLMEGRARESFAALIQEALAEPGIGYARLENAAAPEEIWEVLLLPLRSDFGAIDRVLGGIVPLASGARRPPRRPTHARLRFRIAVMSIRPVDRGLMPAPAGLPAPAAPPGLPAVGFAESQTPFAGPPAAPGARFTAIDGGRSATAGEARRRARPNHLRLVKDD